MVERLNMGGHIPYPQVIFPHKDNQLVIKKDRSLGAVYTPPDFVHFLTSWAIKNSRDKILDVGIGEGAFVFSSYRRLLEIGAKDTDAQRQLYGAEIDVSTYKKFSRSTNISFPNLHNENFFKVDFPPVDVVVGNPPYVRRSSIEDIDQIRESVIKKNTFIKEVDINRMTDLYIYFLLQALSVLKPTGRIAVITADPWLNVGYGEGFKKYLQQHFQIEGLISLDHRVFDDAEVKPVLLLATKKEKIDTNWSVPFIRVKNGLPIGNLQQILNHPETNSQDVIFSEIKASELKITSPWSIHFKVPELYKDLASHKWMSPISKVAQTRIGLQTLAKEFFVLTPEQVEQKQIESEFVEPLAQSLRYVDGLTIEVGSNPKFYLFYCSEDKENLQGTHALEHVMFGETTPVKVRGKNITLIGFHNKERIQRSSRKIWYNLKTALGVRGRASILIPRLIYHNFKVIWNKASFVPGELFIEFIPHEKCDDEVYLAILNSSISEVLLRAHAQVYGGGTYNINPGEIKNVPILDIQFLTDQQKDFLKASYLEFLLGGGHNRIVIDRVVYEILEIDQHKQGQIKSVLNDLLLLATTSSIRSRN